MTDIVLLTVDSLRADHVGWHGYERETTPFLDTVHENAHTFLNAFSNGRSTPRSFPAIMASEYSSVCVFSEDGRYLDEEYDTIAESLSDGGYTTGGFHSNPHLLPQFGYDRGFDTFYDSKDEQNKFARLRQWVKDTIPQDSIVYRTLETLFAKSEETVGFNPGTPFIPADELTDRAIEWVETTEESPRFLWVHYMDVHHPYMPPAKHQRVFRDSPISERRAVRLRRRMLEEPETITEDELDDIVDLYDGEIRFVDAEIERLVETIRTEWGNDTVLSFTSDHGDELADHGGFAHANLYDELLHVPLLVGYEGTDDKNYAGAETHDDLVALADLPPTLLDCAGLDTSPTFQGTSLVPCMSGEPHDREYVISEGGRNVAYRDTTWKYIVGQDSPELYNLVDDPVEQQNVLEDNPDVVEEIEEILRKYPEVRKRFDSDLNKEDLEGDVQDRLEQLGYLQE